MAVPNGSSVASALYDAHAPLARPPQHVLGEVDARDGPAEIGQRCGALPGAAADVEQLARPRPRNRATVSQAEPSSGDG